MVWKSSVRLSNYSKTLWQTLLADSLLAFEALASYIHQLSHFRLLRKIKKAASFPCLLNSFREIGLPLQTHLLVNSLCKITRKFIV